MRPNWRTGWDSNSQWTIPQQLCFQLQSPRNRTSPLCTKTTNSYGTCTSCYLIAFAQSICHHYTLRLYVKTELLADRVGFEPTEPFRARSVSNRVLSASQPPVLVVVLDWGYPTRGDYIQSKLGGSGEIRTHGTSRFSSFQDWRINPLSHTSKTL